MSGRCAVLRVEPDVSYDEVGTAIAVEVGRGDRGPPAGSRGCEAGPLAPVLEALPPAVMEILHASPLEGEHEVGPSVAIDIAPDCRRHHAHLAQARGDRVSHVLEPSPAIDPERASRRDRVLPRNDPAAEEEVEPP